MKPVQKTFPGGDNGMSIMFGYLPRRDRPRCKRMAMAMRASQQAESTLRSKARNGLNTAVQTRKSMNWHYDRQKILAISKYLYATP